MRHGFSCRVAEIVRSIPPGRVASYGAVAEALGSPAAARAVGRALAGLPDGADVPWWRVVNWQGKITIPRAGHAAPLQRALLADEGVGFDHVGRADMARFGWRFPEEWDD